MNYKSFRINKTYRGHMESNNIYCSPRLWEYITTFRQQMDDDRALFQSLHQQTYNQVEREEIQVTLDVMHQYGLPGLHF